MWFKCNFISIHEDKRPVNSVNAVHGTIQKEEEGMTEQEKSILRLEFQIEELIRIVANLNQRIHQLEEEAETRQFIVNARKMPEKV